MQISQVYIHYPFCTKKCHYCNFVAGVRPSDEFVQSYHQALLRQINHYKNQYSFSTLKSLYFGGGTPSLMPIKYLEEILSLFPVSSDTEITLEINPETIQKDWYKLGINRASLGWQSMNDDILKFLGRTSTADDNIRAFESLREDGFQNITVDRILSVNGDDDELFFEAIKKCMPDHISSYQLSIEDKTVLSLWTKQKKYTPVPDEVAIKKEENIARQFEGLGYSRYEISNYAQKDKEGRHNLGYWNYNHWLGVGVGASGFLPNDGYGFHYTNTASFHEFCKNPLAIQESEAIDLETAIKEFLMLGIRKRTGINKKRLQELFDISWGALFDDSVNMEYFIDSEDSLILRPEMIALTNPIILELWDKINL